MWKILTARTQEEISDSLVWRRLFPKEQKGCYKDTRGTSDILYIDQFILKEQSVLTKKVYDMVLQSLKIYNLEMYKISNKKIKFIKFITKAMKNWKWN